MLSFLRRLYAPEFVSVVHGGRREVRGVVGGFNGSFLTCGGFR